MRKKGWSDHFSVEFTYGGLDFTCKAAILIGKDGQVVNTSIFELKPADEGVKKAAAEAALKTLDIPDEE